MHRKRLVRRIQPRRGTTRRKPRVRADQDETVFGVEERLRIIWDSTTEYAIVMLDLDGRITGWNKGAESIFGHEEREVLGQSARILFTPEDWERISLEMKIARETGRAENERWQKRKDGRLFWASGAVMPLRDRARKVVGFYKILRDMTQRKREEELLRESENRFRQLADLVPSFVWVYTPEGQVAYVNARWQAYTGLDAKQSLGMGWTQALHPDDRQAWLKAWGDSIEQGKALNVEARIRDRNGRYRWRLTCAEPVRDAGGAITSWFGVSADIEDRKQAEEALKASKNGLQRRAEELDRLVAERTSRLQETVADLEEFAYTVAHDLRAPLRAVEGYSVIVRKRLEGKLEPEIDQLLARIAASILRMDRMTQDVLTYGKVATASMKVSSVDLDSVTSDVLKQLVLPKRAEVRVARPLQPVTGNASLLSQCILNLVTNALKFIPEGRVPLIEIWTEPRHDSVRLWVKDNGIGIDPQYFEKIFKPFERLHPKESYEGMGIGLAIVKKAVERTGGQVGVESQLGAGSRFWIELPRA